MEKRLCKNSGRTRMRKQEKKVSAWWTRPLLGVVFPLVFEAFVWSSSHAAPFAPSLREGGADVFVHQSRSLSPFDASPLLIGRGGGREGEAEGGESLPPEERREMRRRMDRWKELSPQDQQLLRKRHQQWQELAPEEQQRMRENLRQWDALSPQQQEQIRKRFRTPSIQAPA